MINKIISHSIALIIEYLWLILQKSIFIQNQPIIKLNNQFSVILKLNQIFNQ